MRQLSNLGHQRKPGDSEATAQWRARMPVRGLSKIRAMAYLYALAHNLMRMAKIAPQLIGQGAGASAMPAAAA